MTVRRSRRWSGLLLPALAAAAPALLLAASCRRPAERPTLSIVWSSSVVTLDPNERFEVTSDTLAMNVFEPLLRYDRQMAFVPVLATHWEMTPEGAFRFHLRPGVKFHDRSPLTADDVVFTLERLRSRPSSEVHRYLVPITSVRKVDDRTVDVVSSRPAGLLSVLTFVYILPAASARRLGEAAFFARPAGTGPYRFVSNDAGREVRLEAWDGYWSTQPAFAAVAFVTEKDDEKAWTVARDRAPAIVFEAARSVWAKHQNDPAFTAVARPGLAVHFLAINLNGGPGNPLSDLRVRKAVRAAIDYQGLALRSGGQAAFPASQLVPPAIVGFNPSLTVPAFVQGAARRLLAEARFPAGRKLRLVGRTGPDRLAEELLSQWNAEGVPVEREVVSDVEYDRRLTACEGDLFISGWVCSTGDAAELLEGNFYGRAPGAAPACGYSRSELDDAIDQIGRTLDPVVRRDLLQEAMRSVLEDLPWIPLIVTYDRHAVTKPLVWEPRPDGQLYVPDVIPGGR